MTNQPTTRDASRPDFPAVVHTYTDALRILRERGASSPSEIASLTERVLSNVRRDLPKLAAAGVIIIADADNAPMIDITDKGLKWVAGQDVAEGLTDEPGSSQGAAEGGVIFLTHAQIFPDHANARRDWDSDEAKDELDALRQDILQNGLLQNLVVRADDFGGVIKVETDDGAPVPTYVLVGGERRWRAIGEAITDGDWEVDTPIPCRLLETNDLGHRLAALAENLQRRNLNPIEKANAFEGLSKCGLTNKEIADRVSSTPEHVQQHRRFLQLDDTDQQRMILPKDDPRHLSVREARQKLAKKDEQAEAWKPADHSAEEQLLLAEMTFAARDVNSWLGSTFPIGPDARTDATAMSLADQNIINLSLEPAGWGTNIGHFTASFKGWAFSEACRKAWPSLCADDRDARVAALHAIQEQLAGQIAVPNVYHTAWLNQPIELSAEGQAIITAKQAEQDIAARRDAEQKAQDEAAMSRYADARRRHLDLLNAAAIITPADMAQATVEAATAIDRHLPWTLLDDGNVIDAKGAEVETLSNHWQLSEPELLIQQMVVVAINSAAGLPTPPIKSAELHSQEQDPSDEDDSAEPASDEAAA
ncbi:Chromosome-partitioning protein Spo0J [compost metagenome]